MTLIRIHQRGGASGEFSAALSIDDSGEHLVSLRRPFDEQREADLAWYYEQHLRFPFTGQVRASQAAASIADYGHALFEQLFADRNAHADYRDALKTGALRIEVAGSPEFQALHWEALKDPQRPQPFALEAALLRTTRTPQPFPAQLRESPTINVLLVTARPHGAGDVSYRTIARPLVETLRQAQLRVQIDVLRPGSYRALVDHLQSADAAGQFYHVIHFDLHGAVLSHAEVQKGATANHYTYSNRYARPDLAPFEGQQAFLFFEAERDGQADPASAHEVAQLLLTHQIPIAILNACQSGLHTGASEGSLASRLVNAGAQLVLGMSYSVTVSAAALLMETLYRRLFSGDTLDEAIRRGRLALHHTKDRRVYYDQTIDLEDWLLPVVYSRRPQALTLPLRAHTPAEAQAFYEQQARRYAPEQAPVYGFVGRDLDILQIERRVLRHNILLLRGMGGAGKTTLLRHLAEWWQTTGLIEQVLIFNYDQQAWNRQQIMHAIAQRLLAPAEFAGLFLPLSEAAQQQLLAERLRATRHLLILDNLESITGQQLAIRHTLDATGKAALHSLLAALRGGQTLVLLGTRATEDWLARGTFDTNVHELAGLDPEAASTLAERVLERSGAIARRADPELPRLLRLLAGYPLALEAVLPNLARQTPTEVLDALQLGGAGLDTDSANKSESILRCVEYAYSNLDDGAQALLLCLAPFTGVLFTKLLEPYSQLLAQQPALAELPTARWQEVLQIAANGGLLRPHQQPGFLELQPILPYFLRTRWHAPELAAVKAGIEAAFRAHYEQSADALYQLMQFKEPQERQAGQVLMSLEYENVLAALHLALDAQGSILNLYRALDAYFDLTQEHQRGLALGEAVLQRLEQYPAALQTGPFTAELAGIIDTIAKRQFQLQRYADAERSYQRALNRLQSDQHTASDQLRKLNASIYHQLGVVTQAQHQWNQAQQHYQYALALFVEFGDRYSQARTYHQLGRVAQAQRQWDQAQQHYQRALALKVEFGDRYSQASTYHQLGRVAQAQRQWDQAQQHYQHALALYAEFGDRYSQARTYHQLGRVAQAQRQWDQAQQHYQHALALKIEFDDRYSQASTYHQLGMVAQEQRQWDQAQQHYQQALAIYVEFGDRYEQAGTYHQLGRVAQAQRQWDQAQQHYQHALVLCVEFGDRYNQANTYGQLGLLAQAQQQWAQAQSYLLTALEIFASFNDQHNLGITIRSLAHLHQASGDASLPTAIAAVLGVSVEEISERLREAAGAGEQGAD